MKKLLTILCLVLLVSCSNEVPSDKLVERNGITYETNSTTPFTGSSVNYYEDGLRVENGKPQVNYTELMFRRNYKNGKKDGLQEIFYYENGQLLRRENYKNGYRGGLWEYFDEEGNLTETKEWKDGELIE